MRTPPASEVTFCSRREVGLLGGRRALVPVLLPFLLGSSSETSILVQAVLQLLAWSLASLVEFVSTNFVGPSVGAGTGPFEGWGEGCDEDEESD